MGWQEWTYGVVGMDLWGGRITLRLKLDALDEYVYISIINSLIDVRFVLSSDAFLSAMLL